MSSFGDRVELFAENKLLDCGCDSLFPDDICEKIKVGSVISVVFSVIGLIRTSFRFGQVPLIGHMVLKIVKRDGPRRFGHGTLIGAVALVRRLDDIPWSAK